MNLRFVPALFLACATLSALPAVAADAKAPPAPRPKMGSAVFAWDKLVARTTPNGERRDVANHATPTLAVFECHITTLNPGAASHEPHRHPQEELIIVKEGTLEVHINGQLQVAGRGSTFFYASNDMHRVRNVGDTRATYWVVNLASAATHTPALHNAASTLKSGVFDWQKLVVAPTKTGERRAVLDGSTVTLAKLQSHVTSLHPRIAAHDAHRHPDEEIVLVREGQVEATINGQAEVGGPGSVFFFASYDLHGLRNAGDTPASYQIIRLVTAATPKPEPAAKK